MELDRILHQPTRTQIAALLAQHLELDFSTLKRELSATDGQLGSHLKGLVEAGYVDFEKGFVALKPRTTYRLTKLGRAKFRAYLGQLQELMSNLKP